MSTEIITFACEQLRNIERRIREADDLLRRLKGAGVPISDLELQIAQLKQQYDALKRQFPECLPQT